ncbi:MAG: AMP-binding protein [Acidimicrobiales bacterium]|nr:AMP-binding protein [Acidimicrobiales bacterium]
MGTTDSMGVRDEVRAMLTGPGSPFELVEEIVLGERMQVFAKRVRTLRELVGNAAGQFGDREFLVLDDQRLTFGDFERQVASAAAWMAAEGIGHGDRVAILSANRPEWVVTCFAAMSLGGIVAAFNGRWTTDEITYAIELTEPALLVGDRRRLERLEGVDHGVRTIVIEDEFDVLRSNAGDVPLPAGPLAEDDPCLILFTSGTTGRSKGAVISHRGLIGFVQTTFANAAERRVIAERRGDPVGPTAERSVTLGTSPLFHVSGFHGQVMINLFTGGTIVYRSGRFDPEDVLAIIEREGITAFTPLGDMGPRVIDHPRFADYDTSSVVNVGFGGAPASPAIQQRMRAAFPRAAANVGMGYGSSESTAVLTSIGGQDYLERPESCGQTVIGTEVEVRGPDGTALPPGVEGEIFVRSPYNMLEYWRNPDATAETLQSGRWLAMGDVGKWDDDGFLYINSRARDMILRNAENIYPIEIEYRLDEHPDVAEAAVTGIDHPEWGQEVRAVVVPREGTAPTAEELSDWCGQTLAAYKVPTSWEIRDAPLPRNAAGKVVKKDL